VVVFTTVYVGTHWSREKESNMFRDSTVGGGGGGVYIVTEGKAAVAAIRTLVSFG